MTDMQFSDFTSSLSNLHQILPREDVELHATFSTLVYELRKIGVFSRDTLARFIEKYPDSMPVIATCAGLGQEQLKNQLRLVLNTSGWVSLARKRADEFVAVLDEEFNIVSQLNLELVKSWTFEDVLVERHLWSKSQGASSVGRGRKVEDDVEMIVRDLGLPYVMRSRFGSRGSETAPCDLAIPSGGMEAKIVVGMKGFNSTGSKLTDAVGEIEKMASARFAKPVCVCHRGWHWVALQTIRFKEDLCSMGNKTN